MATKTDIRGYFSQLKSIFRLTQRFAHTLAEGRMQEKISVEKASTLYGVPGQADISRWKKVDARNFGITTATLSQSSWVVLKILRNQGFEAYLVGGCVRDLILKRTPKDFDVITTANLKQIKRIFHNAYIVGRRFPICQVNLQGSVIEVSSFKKAAAHEKEEAETHFPKMPVGCSEIDFIRWRDCTRRDFTINSMFYDPFGNKIYDYANAMMDLKLSKLQTLTPAHMSFTEDCARILRGIRIAARLGFSFSKDAETAIRELYSSITTLTKSRLMMELNYMLSYGAAEPSLYLLRRFKVLEIMLPFHNAYLINHSGNPETPSSSMLMKLLSSLDKVATCGQPCDSLLWVGIFAFHLALVNSPQQPLVVWTFSALLYYGNWNEAIKSARQHAFDRVCFEPEILKSFKHLSDEKLAQNVSKLASVVQDSINILSDFESLHNAMMARYSSSPSSGMVFIPRRFITDGARLFDVLVHDIQSITNKRESYEIDRILLGKGNISEVRFVLGKIIMDTLSPGVVTDKGSETASKRRLSPSNVERTPESIKKQKLVEKMERRVSQQLTSSSKKKPNENTVLQVLAELAPEPINKAKLMEKEQTKVMKDRKVGRELLSSFKKKPKENSVLQEQAELAPEPIKKEKLMEKEQKKVMKERKVSSKTKPGQKHLVVEDKAELAPAPIKKEKLMEKEQKKVMKERTVSSKTKPSQQHLVVEDKADEKSVVKETKNVGRLSSLFK